MVKYGKGLVQGMSFMDHLKETLDSDYNVSITENGAVGYRTTGKKLLDLNFQVSSLRNQSEQEVENRLDRKSVV